MFPNNTTAHMSSGIRFRSKTNSSCRADLYCGLRAKLAITDGQMEAWAAYADVLSANDRRVRTLDDSDDQPFGSLQDRLAPLASMRQAAAVLLSVLDEGQQQRAMPLLPLCCMPIALA